MYQHHVLAALVKSDHYTRFIWWKLFFIVFIIFYSFYNINSFKFYKKSHCMSWIERKESFAQMKWNSFLMIFFNFVNLTCDLKLKFDSKLQRSFHFLLCIKWIRCPTWIFCLAELFNPLTYKFNLNKCSAKWCHLRTRSYYFHDCN